MTNLQHVSIHIKRSLVEAFDDLLDSIRQLCDTYRAECQDAWAKDAPTPDADWLWDVLTDFWYEDGQDGRSTRAYVGLVAASPVMLDAVRHVNRKKDLFHAQVSKLKEQSSPGLLEMKEALAKRHPAMRNAMERTGLARLNLKQCWRHIPMIDQPALKVSFTWYVSGRSIRRITVQDAADQLERLGLDKPHIQIQMQVLASLPTHQPLAQVQLQAPLMRANVTFPWPEGLEPERGQRPPSKSMNISLPLFVATHGGALPSFKAPSPTPPEGRISSPRKDKKISDEPVLSSIRVHRYLSPPQ